MATTQAPLITSDPAVLCGKPVVSGTRITVESILERLAAGETPQQILGALPRLTPESISAALQFAAEALKSEKVHPLP
jgi:uncharacterized protein (DUF433 family)